MASANNNNNIIIRSDESPILSPPGARARLLWFGSVDLAGHRIVVWLHRAAYSTGVR